MQKHLKDVPGINTCLKVASFQRIAAWGVQLGNGAEVSSLSYSSPCQPGSWLGEILAFGIRTGIILGKHHFETISAGSVLLLAKPVTLQWIFSCEANHWLCSSRKPVRIIAIQVSGWIPAVFNEGWVGAPRELFLLPFRQHCLFCPTKVAILLLIFSLSLTAKSRHGFSAEYLEGFLLLPRFLRSLHRARQS